MPFIRKAEISTIALIAVRRWLSDRKGTIRNEIQTTKQKE